MQQGFSGAEAHPVGAAAQTKIAVGWDGELRGYITLADAIKPSSKAAIAQLKAQGLRPVLLTGDNRRVAEAVARKVGIAPEDVFAEVMPEDEVDELKELQEGADAAIEASDITLVRVDLRQVSDAIALSRKTLGTIKGNLFWAFAYNVAAIPLAASGLLNPMYAGAAMPMSSLFVVGNSLRLKRYTPPSYAATVPLDR